MKKAFLRLAMLCAMVCLFSGSALAAEIWDGSVAESFAGGNGTAEDPYLISNGGQLALVNSYLQKHFRLTADIYLNDTADWKKWSETNAPAHEWGGIGSDNDRFGGSFDGAGHTIYGLYMSTAENYTGLFSRTKGALIKDLYIKESFLFTGGSMCGLLIGEAMEKTAVVNCHNSGNVVTTGSHVAGLIGQAYTCELISNCTNSGTIQNVNSTYTNGNDVLRIAGVVGSANNTRIENCVNTGAVSSYGSQFGGVIGHAFSGCEITNCVNKAAVTGYVPEKTTSSWPNVGGVIGSVYDGVLLKDCENHGDVVVEWEKPYAGGIVSKIDDKDRVTGCLNTGDVVGGMGAGGIVGDARGGVVDFCENTGDITVTDATNSEAGGITGGTRSLIRNCVNTGSVSGAGLSGGIAGGTDSYSDDIYNCCNVGAVSAARFAGGICATIGSQTVVRNCWNGGIVTVEDPLRSAGFISASAKDGNTINCYALNDCCENAKDAVYVTGITEEYLESADFLKALNDWVLENQRPATGYALWQTDTDGYPVPAGEVPDYTPVVGNLTLIQPENGAAALSANSAWTETEITVTVTADEGFIPYQVWFCGQDAPDTPVYAEKSGQNTFAFPMPYGDAQVYVSVLALPDNPVWDGSVADSFAGGDGTENNPYLIGNASQMARIVNFKNSSFRLVADIYLNDTSDWENWTAENGPANKWTPPYYQSSYAGIFDGDGHTIYGLYTDAAQPNQGLLYQIGNNGCVKNLTIDQSKVFGTEYVGAFTARNFGTVENCINKAPVTAAVKYCGGIAGQYGGVISDCINYGDISSAKDAGGIGGSGNGFVKNCVNYGRIFNTEADLQNDSDSSFGRAGGIAGNHYGETITQCINYGSVEGYHIVGGITGLQQANVEDCVNYGTVTVLKDSMESESSGEHAGGISGDVQPGAMVSGCVNYADVSGVSGIGGICGYLNSGEIKVCVNYGEVYAAEQAAGGIAGRAQARNGRAALIELCVNKGDISMETGNGSYHAGGLAGYFEARDGSSAVVRNCYNEGDISGYQNIGGLLGDVTARHTSCTEQIENCYSTGTVSGSYYVSGTVGMIRAREDGAAVTVQNCYCLNKSSADIRKYGDVGTETVNNVAALSSEQMAQPSNFIGFDFDTVWYCAGDGSYPVLLIGGQSGQMGEALTFTAYQSGVVSVTADSSNSEPVYALLVSYEDGRMKSMDMVQLNPGEEEMLRLQEQGDSVKLLGLSDKWVPFSEAQSI